MAYKKKGKIKIFFKEEEIIEPLELSQFLFLIDRLYFYLKEHREVSENLLFLIEKYLEDPCNKNINFANIEKKIRNLNLRDFRFFIEKSAENLWKFGEYQRSYLAIYRITKESPLKIFVIGILAYLIIALTIAGGKLKISIPEGRLEVEINSLGDGIEKILDAIEKHRRGDKDE